MVGNGLIMNILQKYPSSIIHSEVSLSWMPWSLQMLAYDNSFVNLAPQLNHAKIVS